MVVRNYKYSGLSMLQDSLGVYNYTANSDDGLVYTPQPPGSDTDTVVGSVFHTHHAFEGPDVLWTGVKLDLTHSSLVSPTSYQNIISLYGLNDGHRAELIGEEIYTTVNATPTTVKVSFDLLSSACQSALYKVDESAADGSVRVDLPFRYTGNFEDAYLTRSWLDGYAKRKPVPITGSTASSQGADIPVEVTLNYDSDMQADFDDIRFTDSDGRTEISYGLLGSTASTSATYAVKVPYTPKGGESRNLYAYYDNDAVDTTEDKWEVYTFYDDFEDNKITGRTSPYVDWDPGLGTAAVTGTSPLYGSYSFTHLGDGTSNPWNGAFFQDNQTSYSVKFRHKLLTQGVVGGTPYVALWYLRLQDGNNWLRLETVYVAPNQIIRLVKNEAGSTTVLASYTWIGAKLSAGTTNDFTITDTGTVARVVVDTTFLWDVVHNYNGGSSYKGVGAMGDSKSMWDRIRMYPYPAFAPTVGAVGAEEAATTVTVTPSTTGMDYLVFSTPADWVDTGYWSMTVKEYGSSERSTRAVPMSANDKFKLGYDAVDKYNTLRVAVETTTTSTPYNVAINNLEYGYEV